MTQERITEGLKMFIILIGGFNISGQFEEPSNKQWQQSHFVNSQHNKKCMNFHLMCIINHISSRQLLIQLH